MILSIIAEVLCPKITQYSCIDQCADCVYYKGLIHGESVHCGYDEESVQ